MNATWIKKICDLPLTMRKDLEKENKYNEKYYGILGVVIGDTLKVGDTFFVEKVKIGVPYQFIIIGIYGSKENANKDGNILSLIAKSGEVIIIIGEPVNIASHKHKDEITTATLQRDSNYYGPLSMRDTKTSPCGM